MAISKSTKSLLRAMHANMVDLLENYDVPLTYEEYERYRLEQVEKTLIQLLERDEANMKH
jgi:Ni,Fe-hydrogenase I small subunit